ncbi:hypothetical protein DFH08DRAFT_826113 [Mycena albidolilacea]|uniref:Uncharacterized protein n=1 Tax=Mycena albidolilacea TaxID=1033008 RepID=A0AAD7E9H8_9AGAR|nr:hypothetical protein DFH08DRAFT_826113 [Mycena albidolilacea]
MISHTTLATIPSFSGDVLVLVHLQQLLRLCIGDTDLLRVIRWDPGTMRSVSSSSSFAATTHPSSISLVNSTLVTANLVSILMETRMLETLRIHAGRGDTAAVDQLLAWLSIDPGHGAGGCLAPNLRTLELSSHGYFDQERFVVMVKSRRAITPAAQTNSKCNLCRPIRRVIIRTTPKKTLPASTIKDLKRLAHAGLHLSLSTSLLAEGLFEPHYWPSLFDPFPGLLLSASRVHLASFPHKRTNGAAGMSAGQALK